MKSKTTPRNTLRCSMRCLAGTLGALACVGSLTPAAQADIVLCSTHAVSCYGSSKALTNTVRPEPKPQAVQREVRPRYAPVVLDDRPRSWGPGAYSY